MRISSSTFGKIELERGRLLIVVGIAIKQEGGQKKTSLIAEGGEISIGKNVGISNSTIYSRKILSLKIM